MTEENQVVIKESIVDFMNITQYVVSALQIEQQIQKEIREKGINPQKYFKERGNDQDIQALQNFNAMVDGCKVLTRGLQISEGTDVVIIDEWGDFLRIWFTQGDPQIFVMHDVDKKNAVFVTIMYFFSGSRCYQYQSGRKLTDEEKKELGIN